jgi:hypothetical protein
MIPNLPRARYGRLWENALRLRFAETEDLDLDLRGDLSRDMNFRTELIADILYAASWQNCGQKSISLVPADNVASSSSAGRRLTWYLHSVSIMNPL